MQLLRPRQGPLPYRHHCRRVATTSRCHCSSSSSRSSTAIPSGRSSPTTTHPLQKSRTTGV